MARLANNGSGKTDWYGSFGTVLSQAFSGQVFTGLDVTAPGSTMAVTVQPGTASIPTGSGASTSAYLVRNDTSGGESVTISTANGSNPRNDLIVAYYDVAVIDTTNPNNPTALKFAAVAGTPAATPADPSTSAIQTAVGASNPYVVLARVRVDTSVTQIAASGKITDLRTMASPQVADEAITFLKLLPTIFSGATTSYTNAGTAGGTFYYLNLGGIKLLYGLSATNSVGTGGDTKTVTLPSSPSNFFNSIHYIGTAISALAATPGQRAQVSAFSTSSVSVNIYADTNGSSQRFSLLIIGA